MSMESSVLAGAIAGAKIAGGLLNCRRIALRDDPGQCRRTGESATTTG